MKLDVTELMSGRVPALDFDLTAGGDDLGEYSEMLPEGIVIDDDGIAVSGRVSNTGGCMLLSADITVDYSAPCDRCLESAHFETELTLERVISSAASAEERERIISEDEDEWDGVTDDLLYVSEGAIDITADVAEAISLELPFRHLCSEDCRGLCPICGKKLSDEHPGCEKPKEIDPRLKVLQKLLDSSEEM